MLPRTPLSRSYPLTPVRWPDLSGKLKDRPARERSPASVARTGFIATALLLLLFRTGAAGRSPLDGLMEDYGLYAITL